LVRELGPQVDREPVDDPAAPAGLHLPLQDVPAAVAARSLDGTGVRRRRLG